MSCNRILFVETREKPGLLTSQSNRFSTLGIGYLISFIKQSFPDLETFCYNHYEISLSLIQKIQPDIIAFSATTPMLSHAINLAKKLNPINVPMILGGVHITTLPASLPEEFVLGVCGEGEETLVELISILKGNQKLTPDVLSKVEGVVYRDKDERIRNTPRRPLITDLDSLPIPDRKAMRIPRQNKMHMLTSRGCPYNCSFCASSHFWGSQIRFRSADAVIEELKILKDQYNPKMICFYDDFFLANHKRFFAISEKILSEGYHRNTCFYVTSRASHVTQDVCEVLKEMNTKTVFMGFESASQNTLQYLKPMHASTEIYDRATHLLKQYRLKVDASFIIGSPNETNQEIRQTFDYIVNSKIDSVGIYTLVAYPGTKIWNDAVRLGVIDPDYVNWEKINDWKTYFLSQQITRDEMKTWLSKFRKEQLRRCFILGLRGMLPFRPYSFYR